MNSCYAMRMGKFHVATEIVVNAPRERVFERITDHERMRDWPGVSACRRITDGSGDAKNGLGAVRRITALGLTLDEQVVLYDPPNGYDYSIVRGLPVTHRGVVRLASQGDATRVTWTVDLSSRVPLLAQVVGRALSLGLPRALKHFSKTL